MLPNPHLPPIGFKWAQGTAPPCTQEAEPAEAWGTPYTAFQVSDVGSWLSKGCSLWSFPTLKMSSVPSGSHIYCPSKHEVISILLVGCLNPSEGPTSPRADIIASSKEQ